MSASMLLFTALLAATPESAPFDLAGFSAKPEEIARWASQHPAAPGVPVEVLLDENLIRFDEAGRVSIGSRVVYRPLIAATAEGWGTIGRSWHPWHEEVPVLRARVIHPDGTVHQLDPATLSQSSLHEQDPVKYGDGRVLRGPLPGIRPGDVVESETVSLERAPYFEAGRVIRIQVGWGPPIRRLRTRVEAPASLPLRWVLLGGVKARPVERTRDGVRVLEWDLRDVPAVEPMDDLRPPDVVPPEIAISTGASWSAVAEAYAARVDERLQGAQLEAIAREVAGGAKDRAELSQRYLDWISSKVRYVALELGEASIIPTKPAETLARGYGDCKDLSTLLVGLLRAQGVRAEVALVRAMRQDPSSLPGLGEFNHAIVHVPGTPPLWIDPTDPETPVGELPIGDQGTMALVAVKGTAGLVRLPELGMAANGLEVEREVAMSEAGVGRAVVVTRTRGFMAAYDRTLVRRLSAEELLKKDVNDTSGMAPDSVLVSSTRHGVEKTGVPVETRYEIANTNLGFTDADDAVAVCRPELVLADLPRRLRTDPDAKDALPDGPPGQDVFLVTPPYTAEERCTIVPPPGFQAEPLPDPLRVAAGPVTLERRAESLPDGRVRVFSKLTVSARRLKDREARELRRLVHPLLHEGLEIKFRRTSTILLAEGKGREALDEIRRLVQLHPSEARHRVHLAHALRALGLGEAARAAARAAVEREPRNGWTHRTLASMLATDLLGRWYTPGCDREGAVAAQRRAVELEKDWPLVRATLAQYLEMGSECFRYGPGAQLDEALAIRQQLRKEGDREHEEDYLELLLRLGRVEEAAALVKSSPELEDAERRQAALVAATAQAKGGAAAQRELERLGTEERRKAFEGAMNILVNSGRWPGAAGLLRAANSGGRGSADARAVADALEKVRPGDRAMDDPTAPRAVVVRLLRATYAAPVPRDALAAVLTDELRDPRRADLLDRITGGLLGFLRKDVSWVDGWMSAELVPVLLKIEAKGDDESGYKLRIQDRSGTAMSLYVARHGKGYRLFASDLTPGLVGDHAARLVAARKLVAARRVLDWARGDGDEAGRVLDALLESDESAPALALAADALSAYRSEPRREALNRLAAAQRQAENGDRKRALTTALAEGLRQSKRWDELLELVGSAGPYAGPAFEAQAEALVALRRPKELRAAADARLARAPGDLAALRAQRDAAVLRGDGNEALRLSERIASAAKAKPNDHARAAWSAAFLDPPPEDGVQHGRRAAELWESYPSLVALATVYAARDEPAEALRVLQHALERKWGWDLGPEAWLVIGRIEEAYGLAEEAKAAYARTGGAEARRRVVLEDPNGPRAFEAAELAERWSGKL